LRGYNGRSNPRKVRQYSPAWKEECLGVGCGERGEKGKGARGMTDGKKGRKYFYTLRDRAAPSPNEATTPGEKAGAGDVMVFSGWQVRSPINEESSNKKKRKGGKTSGGSECGRRKNTVRQRDSRIEEKTVNLTKHNLLGNERDKKTWLIYEI